MSRGNQDVKYSVSVTPVWCFHVAARPERPSLHKVARRTRELGFGMKTRVDAVIW